MVDSVAQAPLSPAKLETGHSSKKLTNNCSYPFGQRTPSWGQSGSRRSYNVDTKPVEGSHAFKIKIECKVDILENDKYNLLDI